MYMYMYVHMCSTYAALPTAHLSSCHTPCRQLFAEAETEQKKMGINSALHIIIFDELDAICRQRGSLVRKGGRESEGRGQERELLYVQENCGKGRERRERDRARAGDKKYDAHVHVHVHVYM